MSSSSPARQPRDLLRQLPQVEKLLVHPRAMALLEHSPRTEVLRAVRETIEALREEILEHGHRQDGSSTSELREAALDDLASRVQPDQVIDAASQRIETRDRIHYRRVINGTGIILHTGLGRAVLPLPAVEALNGALRGYTLVEIDAETGERNRREEFLERLLCELTGAEAGTVVNNNAAATLIILAALARGGEVIISRGQLVEIGGSYRIPDVMVESGARLVEVGTTNRTYGDDYRQAITPETALLMKVHTSNYEITGFAHHTPLEELVALGKERDIPVVSDLGSGCFIDLSPFGFRREPLVSESIDAGADLACFSGDKLLGGPQAGIIVGRREMVEKVRRHALFRAMRPDKMTLVALEATLRLFRDPDTLGETLPALRMITCPEGIIERRAQEFSRAVESAVAGMTVAVTPVSSQTGSGSLPAQNLPSWAVALEAAAFTPDMLVEALRHHEPPIFARIQDDRVLLDLRTLLDGDEEMIIAALQDIIAGNR